MTSRPPTTPRRSLLRVPVCARAAAVLLLLLLGTVPPGAAHARDDAPPLAPVVAALADAARSDSRALQLLDELVNGIGPRLTGSANLARAEEWALARFAALGLPCRLERWGEIPVGFERGPSTGGLVAPETRRLEFITRAWSAGTGGPLRGPARLPPADDDGLARVAETLAGAWVLLPRTPREALQDEAARAFLERREEALERAPVAGFVRPSGAGERLRMSGSFRIAWDELPQRPSIVLQEAAFDELVARVAAGEALELQFDADNRFVRGPVAQHNVVAELPGRDHPASAVIVGAHLDSWDGATGATDDGTGVAAVLEAARLLVAAGAAPSRTIRFVLFGGEEQGLHGSRAYVQSHAAGLADVSAVLVLDEGTNPITGLHVTRAMEDAARRAFAPLQAVLAADPGAPPFELHVVEGLPRDGSSDHAPFKDAGVPGFFFVQHGPAEYARTHHTQHDTFDAVDAPSLRHNALVLALAALGLAELPEPLPRRGLLAPLRRLGLVLADDGVTVRAVADGGLAAAHGMQAGDVLLSVNGEALGEAAPLAERRDGGEPRKVIAWRRAEQQLEAVFAWDEPFGERDPQPVSLSRGDGAPWPADYVAGSPTGPLAGAAVVLLPRADDDGWHATRAGLHASGVASLLLHAGPAGSRSEPSPAEVAAALGWLAVLRHAPVGVLGAPADAARLLDGAPSP